MQICEEFCYDGCLVIGILFQIKYSSHYFSLNYILTAELLLPYFKPNFVIQIINYIWSKNSEKNQEQS